MSNKEKQPLKPCPFCEEPRIFHQMNIEGIGFTISVWVCEFCHNVFRYDAIDEIRKAVNNRPEEDRLKLLLDASEAVKHEQESLAKHLRSQLTTAREERDRLHGDVSHYKDLERSAMELVTIREAELTAACEEIEYMQCQCGEASKLIGEKDEEIEQLKTEKQFYMDCADDNDSKWRNTRKSLDGARDTISNLRTEIVTLHDNLHDMQESSNQMEVEIERLKAKCLEYAKNEFDLITSHKPHPTCETCGNLWDENEHAQCPLMETWEMCADSVLDYCSSHTELKGKG